ncbi:hypothetical protein ALC62_04243 [Cyphomyrmex costatus]|uniref:Uncharacterized protein n=2 Tax=Cyphomyrmex costatus TaxID=456900 RepID=A0A195CXI9_9HYME|nr:hypothetical protein ALC62_04243 [Cyphomyrmex costatus]
METPNSVSSSNNDNENIELANRDATAAEKTKLLREINELRSIIKRCELKLQTRFKDIEDNVNERSLQSLEIPSTSSRILNVEDDLKDDLYRFAGFHCVKAQKNEFVFNFMSTNEKQKNDTQAVQIFVKDGKAELGKWVMPVSIDINDILSKTPIDNLDNLNPFLKSCKHHVDCYNERQRQFLLLKEHMSHIKYCTLQSDMEFLQISLELYSVYIRENDSYINLIIHLLYHSDNVRPYMVKIDTINENELSSDIKQRLKPHFMKFKMSDLHTAFDEILSKDNSTFTWMQKDDTDESLLELNDTDSSDEENFLVQLQSKHKRSLRSLGKRELQKRNTRKKQKIDKNTKSSEDNSTDSQEIRYPKTKKAHTKSSQQISIKKNKAKKATFVLRQKKINKNSVETTSLHRSNNKIKLKQTKLNFQTRTDEVSNKNQTSSSKSKLSSKPDSKQSKISKLIASTPLHNRKYKVKNVPSSPTLEISNITSIEEKTANKLDYSKDRDELGKDSRKS